MPNLTSFSEKYADGTEGEEAFGKRCAQEAEAARGVFGSFDQVRIRCQVPRPPYKIEGVSFFFEPSPREDQILGDLTLAVSGDPASGINVEVKTEEYCLGERFSLKAPKTTPNIAFECYSVVTQEQYETYWTDPLGKFKNTRPINRVIGKHFEKRGGHLVTEADWLVHNFQNGVAICLSNAGLKQIEAIVDSVNGDAWEWFCASTRTGRGRYYTIGKKIPAKWLLDKGLARRF